MEKTAVAFTSLFASRVPQPFCLQYNRRRVESCVFWKSWELVICQMGRDKKRDVTSFNQPSEAI